MTTLARQLGVAHALAAVHPTRRVPHRAQVAVGLAAATVAALFDLRGAIGFSSCTVLVYYAVANAAALTLPREPGRRLPVQAAAVLGLVGCAVLALALPWRSTLAGFGVLALGALWFRVRRVWRG